MLRMKSWLAAPRRAQTGLVLFFSLGSLEALLGIIALLCMPKSQNALLLGISRQRLVLLALLLSAALGFGWAGLRTARSDNFTCRLADRLRNPAVYWVAAHAAAAGGILLWLVLFGWERLLKDWFAPYRLAYERMLPVLVWLFLVCLNAGAGLWLIKQSKDGNSRDRACHRFAKGKWQFVWRAVAVLFSLMLYLLILRFPIPKEIGYLARYDLALLSAPVLFVLYAAFKHSGYKSDWIALTAALLLSGLALGGLWNSGTSEEPIVLGLLPYKDPRAYYSDALRLLNGFPILDWGGRPLFTGFMSVLLGLTRMNLQTSLTLQVAVTSLAYFLAAREIRRSFGAATAAFAFYLFFLFFRQFIGSTLTENLGLAFGALSLSFLLRGARQKHLVYALSGLFLASLALNTRPGPFFILPFLILWLGYAFAGWKPFRARLRLFLIGATAVLLVFLLNYLLIKTISMPTSVMFSRFPHTFYGVAVGGKSWQQIYTDHPETIELPDRQQSQAIYALAWVAIRTRPDRFLSGIAHMFREFFTWKSGAFSFVLDWMSRDVLIASRNGLFVLGAGGLLCLLRKPKIPEHALILFGLPGILLSLPFVPAGESDRMRTYAAVVPWIALIPALSLRLPFVFRKADSSQVKYEETGKVLSNSVEFAFALTLTLVVLAGPFVVKALARPPIFTQTTCPDSQQVRYIRISQGAFIRVISDEASPNSRLPDLRISDVKYSVNDFAYRGFFAQRPYRTGMIVLTTIEMLKGGRIWALLPAAGVPLNGEVVAICGQPSEDGDFFYAESLLLLPGAPKR